jgi:hypothetical protein
MQTKESHAEAKCVAQGLTEVVNDLREGCHATHNGGYHDEPAHGAFHHGMDTVCNVIGAGWLERAIAKHCEFPTTTASEAKCVYCEHEKRFSKANEGICAYRFKDKADVIHACNCRCWFLAIDAEKPPYSMDLPDALATKIKELIESCMCAEPSGDCEETEPLHLPDLYNGIGELLRTTTTAIAATVDVEKYITEASALSNRGRFEEAFNVLVNTLRSLGPHVTTAIAVREAAEELYQRGCGHVMEVNEIKQIICSYCSPVSGDVTPSCLGKGHDAGFCYDCRRYYD